MNYLERFATAWLLMWATAYIVVAACYPQIAGDPIYGVFYLVLGVLIAGLTIAYITGSPDLLIYERLALFVLAIVMVYGGIISFTGIAVWNVPFENKEVFQVSMAFADLIAAVFMLVLATHEKST